MEGSILVVERNAATRDLVAGNLQHAGYQVSCAGDITEAEKLVRGFRPDVALLDWTPGSPGLTFTRQLRSDRRTADISIIMVSARTDEEDRVAALESGADDYVTKPFSMRELLARVKAVLRRRSPQLGDDVVEVFGLRVDPALRRVTARGGEIPMRKIEFDLLLYFMTHSNRPFSRSQLLDQVWGDHVFVEERTVDVHVRRLRRAMAPSGHDSLIETVRGVGYRFRSPAPTTPAPALCGAVTEIGKSKRSDSPQPAQFDALYAA